MSEPSPPATAETTPAPAGAPAAPAPKARRALLARGWQLVLAAVVGLPLAAAVAAVAVLHSATGSAWLLSGLPGVQVQSPRGALLGAAFSAESLRFRLPSGRGEIEIRGLAWQGAQWRWWLGPDVWASASFDQLGAQSLRWRPAAGGPANATPPADLALPMQLQIGRLSLGRVFLGELTPITDLEASIRLGAQDDARREASGSPRVSAQGGQRHEIRNLSLGWDRLRLSGELQIDAAAPMNLGASLELQQAGEDPQWRASLQAEGPLRTIQLQAALKGMPPAPSQAAGAAGTDPKPTKQPPASAAPFAAWAASGLQARAVLRPFEPWPLGDVDLQMSALDLQALASGLPHTRLSGQARLRSSGPNSAFELSLMLDNPLSGPWDQGRLPVGRAAAEMRSTPGSSRIEMARLDLDLGATPAAAAASAASDSVGGRWRSAGRWDAQGLSLEGTATRIDLRALHRHAPGIALSGPLAVRLDGLPSPQTRPSASAKSPGAWELQLRGELGGRIGALPQSLMLLLEARASAQRIELRRLDARLGEAQAQLSALAEAVGPAWRVRSEGRLQNFDPQPWLPGDPQAEWRKASSRLNAGWQLDLSLPALSASMPALQWLQGLRGQGRLDVAESWVAGAKVQGTVELAQAPAAAPGERSTLLARWTVGRNQAELRGQGDLGGNGENDRWVLQVDAPRVEDLAPLAQWQPAAAEWRPQSGRVRARIQAQGRWPSMSTQGEGEIEGLHIGAVSARSGRATWVVDTGTAQPLEVRGELSDAAWGPNRLALLRGEVRGSWREHRATMEVAVPLVPPPQLERLLGLRPGAGTQARVALDGGWRALGESTARWSGTLQRLAVGSWPGSATRATAGSPASDDASWIEASGLRGELDFGSDGRLLRAQAAAGSARLASGLNLRWDRALWRAADPRPEFEFRAELEPFALAPWLNRVDSELQWEGDLRVGARVSVAATEAFQVDAEIRRQDGDLIVGQEELRQPLGLSEASLRLRVQDGRWSLSPAFKGAALGTVAGSIVLSTAPGLRWPVPQAALDGTVSIEVADLGVWGGWLPPGWRVDGALSTRARLSGRLGAPELTGELLGQRVGVRNLLQGVSLRDGDIRIALQGPTARIEHFSLRGGEGSLAIEGEASLGAQPAARLELKAQRLRLLGRIDRQLVASGQARLRLAPDRVGLDGRIALDSGLFDLSAQDAPALDDDVRIRTAQDTRPEPARPVATAPSPLMRATQLSLDVDLGERLRLRGRGLETTLQGLLRLGTPGGRLAVNGNVRTVAGNYAAYGQKLQIERGVLAFDGRVDQPRLDILALRPNTDMRVGVTIGGRADAPRVRLYSEPEMGETDKLSWLVLGRGSEGLARADTTVLQRAAVALLAGEGDAPIDPLLRAFGIDELSLRQGDGEVREAVVSLGKQLSRNWFVGYERGVNATAGTWQLIYRLAQRFTLRAQSGTDNSLDLIWTWRFDDRPGERAAGAPP